MTFTTAITECFNDIVLGLTPLQRLDAVEKYHRNAAANRGAIIIGLVVVVTITVLLLIWAYHRKKNGQKSDSQLFAEYVKTKELTDREYRILMDIAVNAGLEQNESIFTLPIVFDRGATWMIEDVQAKQGIEQSRQLEEELSSLREKLGFQKISTSSDEAQAADTTALNSREIP
jgi:hypothetical protein